MGFLHKIECKLLSVVVQSTFLPRKGSGMRNGYAIFRIDRDLDYMRGIFFGIMQIVEELSRKLDSMLYIIYYTEKAKRFSEGLSRELQYIIHDGQDRPAGRLPLPFPSSNAFPFSKPGVGIFEILKRNI